MAIKQNTIKIDADIKSVDKSFDKLKKSAQELNKQKIAINVDDKKVKEFVQFQKDVIANTKKEIQKLTVAMNEAFDDKKVEKLKRRINELKKDIKDATTSMNDVGAGGGFGGTGGGGSGLGGLLSGGGITKLLKGGVYGAVAMAAFGAVKSILGPAFQAASSRVQLRGLGVSRGAISQMEGMGAMEMGFGMEETRQQAIRLARGTGSAAEVNKVQLLSRATGVNPEDLIGVMQSFRGAGLKNGESIQVIRETLTSSIAAGFDQSRAFDVLETIASKTSELAQSGEVDPQAIAAAATQLMSGSSYFQQNAGRSMNTLSAVDSLFTGGGAGKGIAFRALSDLYRGQGLSPTQLLYETNMGLFKSTDSTKRLDAAGMAFLREATGNRGLTAGGGLNQITNDQLLNASMAFSKATGDSQEGGREFFTNLLTMSGKDREGFLKEKSKALENLQRNTNEILNSQDMKLLQIAQIAEKIRLGVADIIIKLSQYTNPLSFIDKSMTAAGPTGSSLAGHDKNLGLSSTTTSNFKSVLGKNQSKAEDIYNYLRSKGVSDLHAKGMLANIQAESNFNSSAIGDGGTSGGLFQHHNERFSALKNFAGADWATDWKKQIDFALSEPHTKQYLSQNFGSAEEASMWFTRFWENPKDAIMKSFQRAKNVQNFNFDENRRMDIVPQKASSQYDLKTRRPIATSNASSNSVAESLSDESVKKIIKAMEQKKMKEAVIPSRITWISKHFLNKSESN